MWSLLRDAKFISSIDLRKAFWQIPLHPEAKEKTVFAIPGRGLFQFKVVPFGLCNCNSAQAHQRLKATSHQDNNDAMSVD
jgi:hypothetical protein